MSNDDKELYVISGNEFNELTETIATFRAEKAELIEALKVSKQYIESLGYHVPLPIQKTLAKIETK
jgi:hypothetical protein